MPIQRTSLPPICADAPNTCSTRARGVAMRRLRFFCASEIPLVALPLRWIWTRQPACFQLRFPLGGRVAAISVDIATGVAVIEQRLKYRGVGHGGVRDGHFTQQFVTLVHAGVQLVAKVVLAVFLCPARIDIFLRALVRFQVSGIVPSLTVSVSSHLLRWTGACTSEVSTIWPQRAI